MDGVNPFDPITTNYSMWPIELCINNLPPGHRKSSAGIVVGGIIPSKGKHVKANKSSGKVKVEPSIDPYLRILVEELDTLKKCKMINYAGEEKTVSVRLCHFCLDFPAIGKVMHLPGSGRAKKACPFCQISGESVGPRTLFLHNRRFLEDDDHCLRWQRVGYPKCRPEIRGPPDPPPSIEEIRRLRTQYDLLPNTNQKEKFTKEHGLKGMYPFAELEDHSFHQDLGGGDIMHTEKDMGVNICRVYKHYKELASPLCLKYSLNST